MIDLKNRSKRAFKGEGGGRKSIWGSKIVEKG